MEPVEVNFGEVLELAGCRFHRDADAVVLQLHWRALQRTSRPLRCFAHVYAGQTQISSLDHDILEGQPPLSRWRPRDEGYERLGLWLPEASGPLHVQLGLYDSEINARAPILASTLPVLDDSSAVRVELNGRCSNLYVVRFAPPNPRLCRVVFEEGIELAAYSMRRCQDLFWLQLRWMVRGGGRRVVRFFGHVVEQPKAESSTLAQFDQDLVAERLGPVTLLEQNIVSGISGLQPSWLRAGLCRSAGMERLRIRGGTVPFDERERCFYLDLQGNMEL